jgi:hypothetical protein
MGYLYARIYPKYLGMRKALTSSEDFIEKVGSKTMFGNDYMIAGTNGAPMKLGAWFERELARIRNAERSESEPLP